MHTVLDALAFYTTKQQQQQQKTIQITWQSLHYELTNSGSAHSEFRPLPFPKSQILASSEQSSVVFVSELKLRHGSIFV